MKNTKIAVYRHFSTRGHEREFVQIAYHLARSHTFIADNSHNRRWSGAIERLFESDLSTLERCIPHLLCRTLRIHVGNNPMSRRPGEIGRLEASNRPLRLLSTRRCASHREWRWPVSLRCSSRAVLVRYRL